MNGFNGCCPVDEFIGDAILALFGAPVAKADDSDRAIACALAMQAEMDAINERNIAEGLPSIRIGIGINTGEVVAGNIGSKKRAKYGVVGHAVNVTSRVEDQTQPGEILVAQSTLDHCSLSLQTGRELRLQPKGVKETISVTAINGIDSHVINGDDSKNDSKNNAKNDAEHIESNDTLSNDTRSNNKLANE